MFERRCRNQAIGRIQWQALKLSLAVQHAPAFGNDIRYR